MPDVLRFQWAGMNRVLNPFLIKPGDLKLCLNYNSDTFYAKTKRGGYSTFLNNPDSATVNNLIPFNRADGYRFVLRNSGTSLYKYAFTGSTWGSPQSVLGNTSFGGVNDQVQTIGDTNVADARLTHTNRKIAQGFKLSGTVVGKSVPSLWILLSKTGSPGDISLRIETDISGFPSGTAVTNGTATITAASVVTNTSNGSFDTTSGTPIDSSTIAITPSWVKVTFTTAPVLTAGTQYHLCINAAGVDGSNYYAWSGSAADVYSNGQAIFSITSGATYNTISGEPDLAFIMNVTQDSRCGSAILSNKLMLSNGVDKPVYTTDGSSFVEITEAPPIKYLTVWQGRVYGGGCVYARSRIYFSRTADPTSWVNDPTLVDSGGWLDVDPDNNGIITGIDVEANRVIVHKEGLSYRLVPDDFGRPAQVVPLGASTTSHWAIGRSDDFDTGYFFSSNGFFSHTGDTPQLISSPIQDLAENVSVSTASDLAGYFFQYKYFCTMGGTITEAENMGERTFTNPLFVYDIRMNEIYLYTTGHALNCFSSWKHTDGYMRMFSGDAAGNTFVWDGSTSDAGIAIDGELESWEDYMEAPHLTKRYEYIAFYTNPGCQASALSVFDGDNPIDLGDLTAGRTKVYFGDNGFNNKNMAIKVKDMSTTTPSVFYGYAIRLTGEDVPIQSRGRAK